MAKYINVGKSNIYVDNSNIDGIIYVKNLEEGSNMKLHERIKKLRTNLHLSSRILQSTERRFCSNSWDLLSLLLNEKSLAG